MTNYEIKPPAWRRVGSKLVEAMPVDQSDRRAVIEDRLAAIGYELWRISCAYTTQARIDVEAAPFKREQVALWRELREMDAADSAVALAAKAAVMCAAATVFVGIQWFVLVVTP